MVFVSLRECQERGRVRLARPVGILSDHPTLIVVEIDDIQDAVQPDFRKRLRVARKIEQLTVQLSLLSKEVASLKGKAPAVPGSRPGARIA